MLSNLSEMLHHCRERERLRERERERESDRERERERLALLLRPVLFLCIMACQIEAMDVEAMDELARMIISQN